MDCESPVWIGNWSVLQDYCYRVAGCVGLQAMRIFGHSDGHGEAFARALGQALQLTNILRDIEEDAQQQRCYIPQSWLKEQGIDADEALSLLHVAGGSPLKALDFYLMDLIVPLSRLI